ncbi:MAG: aldo/keto reductase [Cytophagaceae bacterium]|nr:MAG: aldo/keto reductase [Cytophagaceae bacterium]
MTALLRLAVAARHGQHPAGVFGGELAHFVQLLHQKVVSTVIIGAKKMEQLEDNLAAVDVKFTPEELEVVEGLMKDNEKWMDPLMEVQVKLDTEGDNTKDPVILVKDLNDKGKLLQTTVSYPDLSIRIEADFKGFEIDQ